MIVGDEVLTAKQADENGPWLLKRLRELGADVRRLAVVADRVEDIADEIRRAAGCDVVITTGGVGPTHDDVTFEGVASGLSEPLVEAPELRALLARAGLAPVPSNLRMCTVPASYRLVYGRSPFPVVRAGRVWVFPGVPGLLRHQFDEVCAAFAGPPVHCVRRSSRRKESALAGALATVAAAHPTVAIGSYPRWSDALAEEEVVVTVEGRDAEALDRAVRAVEDVL